MWLAVLLLTAATPEGAAAIRKEGHSAFEDSEKAESTMLHGFARSQVLRDLRQMPGSLAEGSWSGTGRGRGLLHGADGELHGAYGDIRHPCHGCSPPRLEPTLFDPDCLPACDEDYAGVAPYDESESLFEDSEIDALAGETDSRGPVSDDLCPPLLDTDAFADGVCQESYGFLYYEYLYYADTGGELPDLLPFGYAVEPATVADSRPEGFFALEWRVGGVRNSLAALLLESTSLRCPQSELQVEEISEPYLNEGGDADPAGEANGDSPTGSSEDAARPPEDGDAPAAPDTPPFGSNYGPSRGKGGQRFRRAAIKARNLVLRGG